MRSKKAITFVLIALLIVSLCTFSGSSFAANQKVSAELAAKIDKDNPSNIPVIVLTKSGLNTNHENKVKQSGGKIKHNLSIIKGFSAEISGAAIGDIAECDDVTRILYDNEVNTCLDTATATINAPSAWASGYTGKGVTVAVIDTGIYPHPDLTQPSSRIIAFKDFVNGRISPYDDNGHGTHVAGIIAGNGGMSKGQYKGVAPQAHLVGVKVLDASAGGRTSNVVAGIQWVIQNKGVYNVKVINLSLGATATESYTSDPLSQASEAAWESGIVVVAAAGNDGPSNETIRTPGINPKIITVGAVDDSGAATTKDDVIADFSSRGPTIDGLAKPDLVAPGVNITSLVSDTLYLPKKNSGPGGKNGTALQATAHSRPQETTISDYYVIMSGTSMATPMVTGTAALILEQNPTWTPDEVKKQLMSTAMDLGFASSEQGAGEIIVQ